MKKCPRCGNRTKAGDNYCDTCGRQLKTYSPKKGRRKAIRTMRRK